MLSLICDGLPPSTGAVLVSPHLRPSRIRSVLLVGESDGLHLCLVDVSCRNRMTPARAQLGKLLWSGVRTLLTSSSSQMLDG